jgi:ABC-type multidrug transport system fused ATPase/permease subunit
LIIGEAFARRNEGKGKEFATSAFMLLLYSTALYQFVALTLLLFAVPVQDVSAVQVLSDCSSLLVWMLVLYCYQTRYRQDHLGLSDLKSIKLFYLVKTLQMSLLFVLLWVDIDEVDGDGGRPSAWESLADLPYYVLYFVILGYVLYQFFFVIAREQDYRSLSDLAEPAEVTNIYERSSIYSRILALWVFPILNIGKQRPIQPTDAEPLRKIDSAAYNEGRFQAKLVAYINDKGDKYALLKAVCKAYFPEILSQTLICTIGTCFDYTGAVFILLLEGFLASDLPMWRGVALVVYMLLCKFLQAVFFSQYRFGGGILSFHLRSGIGSAIYNKSLRVSSASVASSQQPGSEAKFTYAQVTNLMQVDLEKINMAIPFAVRVVVCPVQLGIGIYLMVINLGHIAASSSIGVIILLFAINFAVARAISKVQKIGMEKRDIRTKAVAELISNMKAFKLYNWEAKLGERVSASREEELSFVRKFLNLQMILIFLNWGSRGYMMMAIVDALSATGSYLTPAEIFAGLSVISVLNSGIRMIPDIISNFMQMLVSMKRIQDYLQVDEVEDNNDRTRGLQNPTISIGMKDCSFTWAKPHAPGSTGELLETQKTLKNLNFKIKKGELVAIVGKVGAGKSSLLESIIGSMNFLRLNERAYTFINGSVAYSNQVPWIQNATIRDNILFGNPLDEPRYNDILHHCRLSPDLDILPGGDQTEIGEKGINLSGGQKARVAIARAVYADTDILLFDDSLSAVDADVGAKIFNKCIKGYCKHKTRVLVTHAQQYLPSVDRIIVLKDGEIIEQGTHNDLVERNGYYVNEFLHELADPELKRNASSNEDRPDDEAEVKEVQRPSERRSIVEAEDRVIGSVGLDVYKTYMRYLGGPKVIIGILVAMLGWQANRMYVDIYLSDWTDDSEAKQDRMLKEHLIVFNVLSATVNIFILFRLLITFRAGLNASRNMFKKCLESLLDAPVNTYYDVTPTGRILNRLTKDQNNMDGPLIIATGATIAQGFTVLLDVAVCVFVVPYVLIVVPISAFLSAKIQSWYITTSRELTRLGKAYAESISRSPIVQNFSETIAGATVIRAFSYQKQFTDRSKRLIDKNSEIFFMKLGCDNWLAIFLEMVSNLVLACSGFYIVASRDSVEAGLAGLALSYAVMLPMDVNFFIMAISFFENSMVSVERLDAMTQ